VIGAVVKKDIQLLLGDRGALASLFVLPVVFIAVFGSMFGGGGGRELPRLPVAHADRNAAAGEVVRTIARSGLYVVERVTADEVRRRVAADDARAGLVFADDFDPLAGRPAELVIDRATPPQVRGPIEGALSGLIARALIGGRDIAWLVAVSPPGARAPLDGVSGFQVAVPGNAVLFGFFLALTVGISFITERRTGTFRRLLAAPVHRGVLLLAKLVPFYLIGLCQMALVFGLGRYVFGMRIAGSALALVVLTCAVVLAATCLGLLIASFAGTEKQVGGVGSICLLVMGLLGGGMIPRLLMPTTMKAIGLATPHAWALDGYYDLLIREGTGLVEVLPQLGAVLGFAALFAAVGVWRFDFER
jgi:ABC-2 type transport system permease protein